MTKVRFDQDRIWMADKPHLLLGGEFQYFRIRRDLWEQGLIALKEAGINAVSTYIPWVWHEIAEGEVDFDGRTAPERDLRGFLYLCRRLEMPLIAKPGPYIYAEYQGFGIPFWLRTHYPDTKMVLPQTPGYQEIALNHPKFLELVGRWFKAVASTLKPLVASGEVVAIQLDNETGMPQFGAGPHLSDHNPHTVQQLRAWLEERYQEIAPLNAAWKADFPTFDAIFPPARPATRKAVGDLAAFVEDYIVDYLGTLKAMWRELGVDTHFYCNDVWMAAWPNHWAKKNQVAPLGFDMYPKFMRVPTVLDQPFTLTFVPKVFDAMRRKGPLMGPEIGGGWLDHQVRVSEIATWQKMMVSYLRGAQGNILYPIQDGVDPDALQYLFGAAIDTEGRQSPRMKVVRALGQFVEEFGPHLARSTPVLSPVAVLHYHDAVHDPLQFTADPLKTARENLDLAIDVSVTVSSGASGMVGALVEAGYDPEVLELGTATLEDLGRHRVCFFASTGTVAAEGRERLARYVADGGTLVVTGTPFTDPDSIFPFKTKRTWRPRSLAVVTGGILDVAFFNLLEAAKIRHPLVRFTVEKLQPVMGLIKHATRAGVWLNATQTGDRVWASRFVSYCQVPPGGQELLNFSGAPVGFAMPMGEGRVAFLGTLLGLHLDSPGYYLDDPRKVSSVATFVSRLLHSWGVPARTEAIAGIEVVERAMPGGTLVGLVNRRQDQEVSLQLPHEDRHVLERQFSYLGSKAEWNGQLQARLLAGDVLVVQLARRSS